MGYDNQISPKVSKNEFNVKRRQMSPDDENFAGCLKMWPVVKHVAKCCHALEAEKYFGQHRLMSIGEHYA